MPLPLRNRQRCPVVEKLLKARQHRVDHFGHQRALITGMTAHPGRVRARRDVAVEVGAVSTAGSTATAHGDSGA
jgi:hypothetical protein